MRGACQASYQIKGGRSIQHYSPCAPCKFNERNAAKKFIFAIYVVAT